MTFPFRPLPQALTVSLGMCILSACSFIVSGPETEPVRCEISDGAPDPCIALDANTRCVNNVCQTQECMPESCDERDNDCDGIVDEGLDEDQDGFTWCPSGPSPFDCDDNNPNIYPAGLDRVSPQDVCDGADNDCNPATFDGVDCTETQICEPSRGCVDVDCSVRPELCSDGQYCDQSGDRPTCRPLVEDCRDPAFPCSSPQRCNPETGQCVDVLGIGSPCTYDAECDTNQCMPREALRLTSSDLGGGAGICSMSCCTDSTCPGDTLCWESGSGARGCVPRTLLDVGYGAPTSESCAGPANCSSDTVCSASLIPAYRIDETTRLTCEPPMNSYNRCTVSLECLFSGGECSGGYCRPPFCSTYSDCPTGICYRGRCRDSCRGSNDCFSGYDCQYAAFGVESIGYLPICFDNVGSGGENTPCNNDSDCRNDTCVDAQGGTSGGDLRCAPTCCSDEQCTGADSCQAIFVHARWEMHCLPSVTYTAGG